MNLRLDRQVLSSFARNFGNVPEKPSHLDKLSKIDSEYIDLVTVRVFGEHSLRLHTSPDAIY